MRNILSLIFFLIFFIFFGGCAADKQSENYNFGPNSPLTLTTTNHPHGYQKTSCFNCHLPQNIHEVDHLQDPSFPFAKTLVDQKGLSSCVGCHGSNGAN